MDLRKVQNQPDRDRNAAINIWKVGASTFFGRDIVRPAIFSEAVSFVSRIPAFRHGGMSIKIAGSEVLLFPYQIP